MIGYPKMGTFNNSASEDEATNGMVSLNKASNDDELFPKNQNIQTQGL